MDTRLWIGALAERTGVSTHLLRVWEERYGLLAPERSSSGYRIYGADDERRVREMVALRARGMAAGDAAAMVLAAVPAQETVALEGLLPALGDAIAGFDEPGTHAVIDQALAGHDAIDVVDRLLFPCLRRLGEKWESGEITIAQEHFGSGLIRGRMLALTPRLETSRDDTRVAVLACPTHERHDIGLLALCLVLRRSGWAVTFLGADTPVPDVVDAACDVGAGVVMLAGTEPHMFAAQLEQHAGDLDRLPSGTVLALGGRAASASLADRYGAVHLASDPFTAGAELDAMPRSVPVRAGA
jgi:MerR family transcriptional regulator, light-induced transcriptional regulator